MTGKKFAPTICQPSNVDEIHGGPTRWDEMSITTRESVEEGDGEIQ